MHLGTPGKCFCCDRMKRILLRFCFVILLLGAVSLVGFEVLLRTDGFQQWWHRCLVVSEPLQKADAIIVLGGEPLARPKQAALLYKQGVAEKVFVSGVGDSARNRQILIQSGVPVSAITMEPRASTTYQNAKMLKPMLESAGVRSALIVTSPFHTRRALACFRKVIPEIRFGVTEASIDWWKSPKGMVDESRFACVELLKTLEYWLLYGVYPFDHAGEHCS